MGINGHQFNDCVNTKCYQDFDRKCIGHSFPGFSISKVLTCFEFINTNKLISVKLNSFKKSAQLNHCWQKLSLRHGALCSHTISPKCFQSGTYEGRNLIVATINLQLIQNRYMFRSFTVLQCSHQHCVQPVASDVEVVGVL